MLKEKAFEIVSELVSMLEPKVTSFPTMLNRVIPESCRQRDSSLSRRHKLNSALDVGPSYLTRRTCTLKKD